MGAGTRIGYVPQKLDIERDLPLTGIDFLRAKAGVSRVRRTDRRASSPSSISCRRCGPTDRRLSGGQFQRLLLAFALIGRPNVLLFDEPTAGIDEPGEEGFYELFRPCNGNRSSRFF